MESRGVEYRKCEPAIQIIGKQQCTGCFGCANACKKMAIEMRMGEEGFYYPEIDACKCNNCGLCVRNCPVLSFKTGNFNRENIETYAAYSTNDAIRLASSSGGVFTEIAEYFIEQGGVVFGAAWTEDLSVEHIGVKAKNELGPLRSSKYIQSKLDDVYATIVKMVEKEGKKVLFTGTPCQVAALKTFTDSDNLYTLDLICHGIPSKLVFDEYLKTISRGQKVTAYTFRDKSSGWSNYKVKMQTDGGAEYECITRQDPFFHGFICDLYLNLACYNCKFATLPRAGDLTIGDFWKISADLMDERGVSVVLVNNDKGSALLHEVAKQQLIKLHQKDLADAIKGNPRIHDGFLRMRRKRTEILQQIKNKGFADIAENYIRRTQRYIPDEDEVCP